ncbi:MAG: hypothetical protein ACREFI_13850 [Stellaceae bacterium]
MSFLARSVTTIVIATALSAGVALLPMAPIGSHTAWPHGGGGGGGGGNGGGNGNGNGNGAGHGNGNGGLSAGAGSAVGSGATSASATIDLGHAGKSAGTKGSSASKGPKGLKGAATSKNTKGLTASALGALNAAHASPNALAHASPNSRVGKIAAYKDAINALNVANANLAACASNCGALVSAQATAQANAAQALANAANKSISTTSVVGVDNLLGVSLSAPTTAADLAAQAAALQTKP